MTTTRVILGYIAQTRPNQAVLGNCCVCGAPVHGEEQKFVDRPWHEPRPKMRFWH